MKRIVLLLAIVVAPLCSGCVFGDVGFYDHLNEIWRSGGGFNNPNADRIRAGKSPQDF